MTGAKRSRVSRITRDTVLFTGGLLLTVNEAVLREGAERPTLIILFAGMMGLPVVIRADEARKQPPDV